MKKELLLSVLCFAGLSSFAQVNQYQTTHELGAGDYGNAIIYDAASGDNIIMGSTNSNPEGSFNILITSADQEGSVGASAGGQIGAAGSENGRSLYMNSNGGLVLGGSSTSFSTAPAGLNDFFSVLFDSAEEPVWIKSWGTDSVDVVQKVIEANDGNVILAGRTNRRHGQRTDILVTKLNAADGDTMWSREVGHTFINESLFDIVPMGLGDGYLLIGYSGANVIGLNDVLLVIIDDSGDMQESFVFGGPGEDDGRSFIPGDNDVFYIAGNTRGIGAGSGDAFLARFDATGEPPTLEWFKTYGSTSNESLQAAIGTSDGNILMTGTTNSFGNGQEGFVVKVNSAGEVQWSNVYGGTGDDFLQALAENADGGFTAVGYSNSFGATTDDLWLVGFDADGNSSCSQTAVTFVEESIDAGVAYMSPIADVTSTPVTLIDRVVVPSFGENNSVQNTVCLTIGINETLEEANSLQVFPIPASDILTVNLPENGSYQLNMYALDGRIISSTTYNGTKAQVSVNQLSSGIYMLEVKGETQTWKSKVVKN